MRSHQMLIYIPAPVYYRVQLVEQSEIFLLYWEHVVFTTCSYVGGIPFISHIFNPLFILVLFWVATPTAIWLTMLRRSLILFWPSSLILPLFTMDFHVYRFWRLLTTLNHFVLSSLWPTLVDGTAWVPSNIPFWTHLNLSSQASHRNVPAFIGASGAWLSSRRCCVLI